ncbi:MAG TPA: hypothetical protein VN363_02415 [Anaerolineales bacterium]|nr:hypothetical protein [Anaerolineales bacterium]
MPASRVVKKNYLVSLIFAIGVLLSFACISSTSISPPAEIGEPTRAVEPLPIIETPANTSMPAIQEPRLITLEWPARLRVGDSDTIRLTLEVDETGGITPTALNAGNETRGERVNIPDLYDTHNVMVEARLDIAGLTYTPTSVVIEPMQPGQAVIFFWSVQPQQVGKYRGTVWLHLHYVPKTPAGQEARMALSAQVVEIEAINFLGLSGNAARVTGWVGAALGSIISLDRLYDFVIRLIKRSRLKPPQQAG